MTARTAIIGKTEGFESVFSSFGPANFFHVKFLDIRSIIAYNKHRKCLARCQRYSRSRPCSPHAKRLNCSWHFLFLCSFFLLGLFTPFSIFSFAARSGNVFPREHIKHFFDTLFIKVNGIELICLCTESRTFPDKHLRVSI